MQARSGREIEDFAAEIEDRFGPIPELTSNLLALARLARSCRSLDITKIDAGPHAIALTFRRRGAEVGFEECDERLAWRGERLVLRQSTDHPEQRLREAAGLLRKLSRRRWH
jgi:transcription-repair coupling factor (superfamily II helicase)